MFEAVFQSQSQVINLLIKTGSLGQTAWKSLLSQIHSFVEKEPAPEFLVLIVVAMTSQHICESPQGLSLQLYYYDNSLRCYSKITFK